MLIFLTSALRRHFGGISGYEPRRHFCTSALPSLHWASITLVCLRLGLKCSEWRHFRRQNTSNLQHPCKNLISSVIWYQPTEWKFRQNIPQSISWLIFQKLSNSNINWEHLLPTCFLLIMSHNEEKISNAVDLQTTHFNFNIVDLISDLYVPFFCHCVIYLLTCSKIILRLHSFVCNIQDYHRFIHKRKISWGDGTSISLLNQIKPPLMCHFLRDTLLYIIIGCGILRRIDCIIYHLCAKFKNKPVRAL